MGAYGIDAAILQYDNLIRMEHGSDALCDDCLLYTSRCV